MYSSLRQDRRYQCLRACVVVDAVMMSVIRVNIGNTYSTEQENSTAREALPLTRKQD